MKRLFLFALLLWAVNLSAQQTPEFELKLCFEDAAGNRDTVVLGYDANATDGIDATFGEVNNLSIPWSANDFEVRITNGWQASALSENETYRMKRQILNNHCGES